MFKVIKDKKHERGNFEVDDTEGHRIPAARFISVKVLGPWALRLAGSAFR